MILPTIRLTNFKAFAETQELRFAPITLLYGPNSAGKSSVLHGIALLHEAILRGRTDVTRTKIGGSAIDLGGFPAFVYGRDPRTHMQLSVDLKLGQEGARILGLPEDDDLSVDLVIARSSISLSRADDNVPAVVDVGLSIGGVRFVTLSRRPDGLYSVDRLRLAPAWPAFERALHHASDASRLTLEDLLPAVRAAAPVLFPSRVLYDAKGERSRSGADVTLTSMLTDLLEWVDDTLTATMTGVRYLGPLRAYPPRYVNPDLDNHADWWAGGAFAWQTLATDVTVRERVNRWLSSEKLKTRYDLIARNLIPSSEVEALMEDLLAEVEPGPPSDEGIQFSDEYTLNDLGHRVEGFLEEVRNTKGIATVELVDRTSGTIVSHRDVGIGISQVLPVLVNAFGSKGRVIAIEQPELHLHPALQAELADVFIEGALVNGNSFILETHSEHLLLRLMRRIRERSVEFGGRALTPADVRVLYVDRDARLRASVVKEIPIGNEGQLLRPWPGGFFEEGLREVL